MVPPPVLSAHTRTPFRFAHPFALYLFANVIFSFLAASAVSASSQALPAAGSASSQEHADPDGIRVRVLLDDPRRRPRCQRVFSRRFARTATLRDVASSFGQWEQCGVANGEGGEERRRETGERVLSDAPPPITFAPRAFGVALTDGRKRVLL